MATSQTDPAMRDHRPMRALLAGLLALAIMGGPGSALAQPATCPPYQGIVCDGWVTDAAGGSSWGSSGSTSFGGFGGGGGFSGGGGGGGSSGGSGW